MVVRLASELTATQRRAVESYLALKWGVALKSGANTLPLGVDTLTGGAGADRFVWTVNSHTGIGAGNRDIITEKEYRRLVSG